MPHSRRRAAALVALAAFPMAVAAVGCAGPGITWLGITSATAGLDASDRAPESDVLAMTALTMLVVATTLAPSECIWDMTGACSVRTARRRADDRAFSFEFWFLRMTRYSCPAAAAVLTGTEAGCEAAVATPAGTMPSATAAGAIPNASNLVRLPERIRDLLRLCGHCREM